MDEILEIDSLLIRDYPQEVKEIKKFITDNNLKIKKIVAERFLNSSILYVKDDGYWEIHYYNYIRHTGLAIPYIYLSLISIIRRENIWFKTINPIELDRINRRILVDHFSDKIDTSGAEKFRQAYIQGIYLGFEVYKLLSEKLISADDVIKLFHDCEILAEHAGYFAALKIFGAYEQAKVISDFFWEIKKTEFIKSAERIEDCIENNKIEMIDYFYIQKQHFTNLKEINFERKTEIFMKENKLEYDLAISFAGEDREIANKISENLKNKGYNIFYDEFEKSKMWGKDLYEYLSEVYSSKAKYCLILISEAYIKKPWTRLEKKSAQSRAFEEENEYILPLRIDDSQVPGILSTTGYIDYRNETFEEIINILIEKINNY